MGQKKSGLGGITKDRRTGDQRLDTQIYSGPEGTGPQVESGRGEDSFESMEEEGQNQE